MTHDEALRRFDAVARQWQGAYRRDAWYIIRKIKEECDEFLAVTRADGKLARLDEIGDVLALSVRLLSTLTDEERSIAVQCAEMKTRRRLIDPGVKDKEAEAEELLRIARGVRDPAEGVRRALKKTDAAFTWAGPDLQGSSVQREHSWRGWGCATDLMIAIENAEEFSTVNGPRWVYEISGNGVGARFDNVVAKFEGGQMTWLSLEYQ